MTRPGIETSSREPLASTLTIMPMSSSTFLYFFFLSKNYLKHWTVLFYFFSFTILFRISQLPPVADTDNDGDRQTAH